MKRIFAVMLVLVLAFATIGLTAFAEEAADTVAVYVTISDDKGKTVLAQEKVTVTDADEDGALTINDALFAAHEAGYEGGAAAGYETIVTEWGISLNKLWGVQNGGSYGYYVNNQSAWSLTDAVKDGDYLNAYAYTDLTTWSDTYCYFDMYTKAVGEDEDFTLTLTAAGYGPDGTPITVPAEGAVITINGERTEFKTDKDGKATITVKEAGTYILSAVSHTQTLVPPVCKMTVEAAVAEEDKDQAESPATGAHTDVSLWLALSAASLAGLALFSQKHKTIHEK